MNEYQEKLARRVRQFRKSGLVKEPFKVRLVTESVLGKDVLGDYRNGVIRIRRGLPGYVARETLAHELAHHISTYSHGVTWAQAYSKLYVWSIDKECKDGEDG